MRLRPWLNEREIKELVAREAPGLYNDRIKEVAKAIVEGHLSSIVTRLGYQRIEEAGMDLLQRNMDFKLVIDGLERKINEVVEELKKDAQGQLKKLVEKAYKAACESLDPVIYQAAELPSNLNAKRVHAGSLSATKKRRAGTKEHYNEQSAKNAAEDDLVKKAVSVAKKLNADIIVISGLQSRVTAVHHDSYHGPSATVQSRANFEFYVSER